MPVESTPAPVGPEFRVSTAGENRREAAVTALPDGGFVVAWEAPDPSEDGAADIYARRYAASGAAAGDEFRVNGTAAKRQGDPDVAVLGDGGFVVAWEASEPFDPSFADVHARRYAADGLPAGGEFVVKAGGRMYEGAPDVTATANGGFLILWTGTHPTGGAPHYVGGARFDADGTAAGHVSVSFFRSDSGGGTAAALADGGLVVAWHSSATGYPPPGAEGLDVYAQRFGADGFEVGSAFRVNDTVTWNQDAPAVAALSNGGFVVAWEGGRDVHVRRFGADGAPVGGAFRVHDADAGDQRAPEVAALAEGGFVVTWQGADGIHARLFDGAPSGPSQVSITAAASSQAEGDAGAAATFTFDVTLDAAPSAPRSVRWQVEGHGARPADASDFEGGVLPSGDLVFATGETRKTVTARVAGDAVVEADEGFAVSLLEPSGGLVVGAAGSATATVLDDDLFASAPPAQAAKVARLYDAALDRSPDRGGFEFWVGALEKGEALSTLASGFLSSPEFAARFGDASADDGAFVERLYQNVLGRAGEAEGFAFWCDSLGKGCTRADVLTAFSESAEHFSESAEHVALSAAVVRGEAGVLFA